MPELTFLVAGRLDGRTGGSLYNRRMAEALTRRGWAVQVEELDEGFPYPDSAALERASAALRRLPAGRLVLIDGLAFGAMPEVVWPERTRLRLVALVHLPLASAPGLGPEAAAHFRQSERRALACARRVIVTGPNALTLLQSVGLRHRNVTVVEPGTDPAPLATGSGGGAVRLLCVGALRAGKGHDVLLAALRMVPQGGWSLTCAGSLTCDPGTAAQVRGLVSRLHLDPSVTLLGELDEQALGASYASADLLVHPSLCETYGMAVAEALARGLPVIATATGAARSLVGDSAGLVVPPGNAAALAKAIARMVGSAGLRSRCAAGARQVRARLANWDAAAARLGAALCT